MATTDEDVAAKVDEVNELRAKVEAARLAPAERTRELDNEIRLTELETERIKLQTELDELEHANDKVVVDAGAQNTLATAKEQLAAAMAHQKAVAETLTTRREVASKSPDELAREKYINLTAEELRTELASRQLATTGNKTELQDRLVAADAGTVAEGNK